MRRQKGKDGEGAWPEKGLSNRLYWQSGAGRMFSLGRERPGSRSVKRSGRKPETRRLRANLGEQNPRDPGSEGNPPDWNPKDNLWENYAHDSSLGNTEATNASARHQGAPGEKKGK